MASQTGSPRSHEAIVSKRGKDGSKIPVVVYARQRSLFAPDTMIGFIVGEWIVKENADAFDVLVRKAVP